MSARRAAREQIKSARARARDMRQRARTRRPKAVAERQPTPFLGATVVVFLLVLMLALAGVFSLARTRSPGAHSMTTMVIESPKAEVPVDDAGPPVLVVVDGDEALLHRTPVRERLQSLVSDRAAQGFDVFLAEEEHLNDTVVELLRLWEEDRTGPADEALELLMEQKNIYGIVRVQIHPDESPDGAHVVDMFIYSTQDGAEDRRRERIEEPPTASAAGLPLLLVNDHPAKSHPRVESYVASVIEKYQSRHRTVVTDDQIEAAVRKVLPTAPIAAGQPLPPRLVVLLQELGLGGVLRIDVAPGVGEPSERIALTRIDLPAEMPPAPLPEAPALPDIPAPPAVPDDIEAPAPVLPW